MDFVLSQTSLKHFEEGCQRKWKGMWLDESIPFYSNKPMDYGKYFEYLAIGAGAIDDDIITDLPRKKNGSKTVDQIRIEEQADRFKCLFDENHIDFLGYKILDTQKVIWSKDKLSRGVEDIYAEDVFTGENVIVDLKLTSDVDATRHPKHWGHDDNDIDITQSLFYSDIEHEVTGKIPRFDYIVFDYSPKKQVKLFKTKTSEEGLISIRSRKNLVRESVNKNIKDNHWSLNPNKWECKTCPLECESRVEEFNP